MSTLNCIRLIAEEGEDLKSVQDSINEALNDMSKNIESFGEVPVWSTLKSFEDFEGITFAVESKKENVVKQESQSCSCQKDAEPDEDAEPYEEGDSYENGFYGGLAYDKKRAETKDFLEDFVDAMKEMFDLLDEFGKDAVDKFIEEYGKPSFKGK